MSDQDLLNRYVRQASEEDFAELVDRHLNLVYSAALRQVRSPQLAEEVSQSVFADLARNAGKLKADTILTAWLYQVARRTAIDVVRRESRRQARERIAVEIAAMNATTDWNQIEPLLDEGMEALDESDRAALLLRYFDNKSLREVGELLGTSDDAAQKRVSRAVERLREFFAKRGVAVGATGLVVVISANAVQGAPAGMAASISTAVLAGTAIVTATLTPAITMTTIQKTLSAAVLTAAIGTAIYEAHQASDFKARFEAQQQEFATRVRESETDRDKAKNQLAALESEISRLKGNSAELLKLRGEITQLRKRQSDLATATSQKSAEAPATNEASTFQTFSTTNNLTVGWGQIAMTGGWKTPSGLHAYVFTTPAPGNTSATLNLQVRIAEMAALSAPDAATETVSGVLTQDQFDALTNSVKDGPVTIRNMRLTVGNGQEATIQSGSSDEDFSRITLTPVISNDGQNVQLQIIPKLNYRLAAKPN